VPHPLAQNDRQSWERQPGEGAKAHTAFLVYRNLGPHARSLRIVGEQLGKSRALIERWSSVWQWVFRCEQWDIGEAEKQADALRDQYREPLERHRSIAEGAMERLSMYILGVEPGKVKEFPNGLPGLDLSTLTPRDAAHLLRVCAELEMRAYGL